MFNKFRPVRAAAILLLALAAAAFGLSCTAKPEPGTITPAEPSPEATQAAVSDREAALAAYRDVLARADSYDYGTDADLPIAGYRYALVDMQSGDKAPTLLLAQSTQLGIEYVRVFRYDAASGNVLEPVLPEQDGALMQGEASVGGFRGEISVLEDGTGLCAYEFYSGTGDGTMRRIGADGDKLTAEQIWAGNVTDPVPFAVRTIENWFDAADVSGLV